MSWKQPSNKNEVNNSVFMAVLFKKCLEEEDEEGEQVESEADGLGGKET